MGPSPSCSKVHPLRAGPAVWPKVMLLILDPLQPLAELDTKKLYMPMEMAEVVKMHIVKHIMETFVSIVSGMVGNLGEELLRGFVGGKACDSKTTLKHITFHFKSKYHNFKQNMSPVKTISLH